MDFATQIVKREQHRERRILRWTICIISLAVAALVYIWMGYATVDEIDYQITEEPFATLTSADISYLQNCTIENQLIQPIAPDAAILFNLENLTDKGISLVYLRFEKESEEIVDTQLFYKHTGEAFSESNSVRGTTIVGTNAIVFEVPFDGYDVIRVDIDSTYRLTGVELYETPGTWIVYTMHFPVYNLIIAIIAALALATVLLVIKFDWHTGNGFGFALLYAGIEIFVLLMIIRSRFIIRHIAFHTLLSCCLLVIGTLIFCILYCGIIQKRWEIWKLSFCIIVLLGICYSVVFRQFTIPDEETHYWATYALSNKIMNKAQQDTDNSIVVRAEDYLCRQAWKEVKISLSDYPEMLKQFRLLAKNNTTETVSMWKPTSVPLAYWFSALGISVGRIFNLSGIVTFYLGRLFNLLVYAIGVTVAIRLIPYGKKAILGIAILPMSIHLAASYSYDGIVLIEGLLFVALTMGISNQHTTISIRQKIALCLLGALLAPSKIVYCPLLFLMLFIPEANYKNIKERKVFTCLFFACAIVVLILIQKANIASNANLDQLRWIDRPPHTMEYVFTHIPEIINTIFTDMYVHKDFYLGSSISQNLGWLQLSSSYTMLFLCSVCLMLCCVRTENDTIPVLKATQKAGVAMMLIFVILLVQVSMLMSWTPIGYGFIAGVQGRYFLPAFPLLLLLIRSNNLSISIKAGDSALFMLIMSSFVVILEVISKLVA